MVCKTAIETLNVDECIRYGVLKKSKLRDFFLNSEENAL